MIHMCPKGQQIHAMSGLAQLAERSERLASVWPK